MRAADSAAATHVTITSGTYAGQACSVMASATFALDSKSELTVRCRGELDGLPLVLVYDRHGLVTGLTRRFKHGITADVQYAYYEYGEPISGGGRNYTAHGVLVGLRKSTP